MKQLAILIFLFCFFVPLSYSQPCNEVVCPCANGISSYPYYENFENSEGGWFAYWGTGIWVRGTPSKPLMNRAGGGNRSMVSHSLAGVRYEENKRYGLRSPCFNLSGLQNPRISFKIFWDTEKDFDGMRLYVTRNGDANANTIIGDLASNAGCRGLNWYNGYFYHPQRALEDIPVRAFGWTGNILPGTPQCPPSGGGSGRWITAKHSLNMPGVSGETRINFIFDFNSNMNDCFLYEGVAIDDIRIEETPTNLIIESECLQGKEYAFYSDGPCIRNMQWDFGDPASGTANYSTEQSPKHLFSAAGTYTVSLSGIDENGLPMQTTHNVNVIKVESVVDWPGMCSNIGNGTITLSASGSSSGYSYSWNTSPVSTGPVLNNVGQGLYISTVSAPGACSVIDSFDFRNTISSVNLGPDVDICPGQSVKLSAGKFSNYSWQDGSSDSVFIASAAGRYFVRVTNAAGCTASDTIHVTMDCKDVYFPYAFTPNGDGLNDGFGPAGNLTGMQQYSLTIFDRYGSKVFFSMDPFKKWNGSLQEGRYNAGSFIWYSEYTLNGKKERKKGAVLLIR